MPPDPGSEEHGTLDGRPPGHRLHHALGRNGAAQRIQPNFLPARGGRRARAAGSPTLAKQRADVEQTDASKALIEYSQKLHAPKMLGHLFTTWDGKKDGLTEYPSLVDGLKLLKSAPEGER